MQDTVTAKDIAQALGISERAVQARAMKDSWPFEEVSCRGGKRRLYPLASLPEDVRQAIAAAMLAGGPAPTTPPAVAASSLPAVPTKAPAPLASLTAHQRETALARLAFVREIERTTPLIGKEKAIRNLLKAAEDNVLAPRLAELIRVANDRFGNGRGLSRRRLYDWCSLFTEGGEAALAPRHPGKVMTVPDWAPAFLAIWQQPQKPSIADAYGQFAKAYAGTPPSIFAVRRWLDKMAKPDREAGRVTGNALLHLRPYKLRKTDELWPTDVYTADGTTFDAEIQHPLHGSPWKPEVTLVVDVATRRVVGLAVGEAECAGTVLDALRVACLWGGIPSIFYVDNGSGYNNAITTGEGFGILTRLDIELRNSIPGRPQGKGLMERAVQTICVAASKRLPTCSHADMDEDAAHKIFKITRAQVKQAAKRQLLPTFEEFKHVLLARVDEYNASPHRSLPKIIDAATGRRRHLTPDEHWQSFLKRGFAQLPVPEVYRDELFMPGIPRKVRSGMVQLFNGLYYAEELADFHGDYVEVRYDMWDSSRVYCWTTAGEKVCTAVLDGNAMDYFPMTQIEAARERRANGKVSRLAKKLEAAMPGATVLRPEATPTYTMLADSVIGDGRGPQSTSTHEIVVEALPSATPAEPSAKRPTFWSIQDRYSWLMHNPDRWTDKDQAWVAWYVASKHYDDLHTYFEARCIAWPGYVQKSKQ
jgi:putative transposase